MTLQEIHSILKSRTFKLTKYENVSCELNFTEIHVFRDNKHNANYNIRQVENGFKLTFDNVKNGNLVNVKNILFVNDNFITLLNFDSFELLQKGKIDYTLVSI